MRQAPRTMAPRPARMAVRSWPRAAARGRPRARRSRHMLAGPGRRPTGAVSLGRGRAQGSGQVALAGWPSRASPGGTRGRGGHGSAFRDGSKLAAYAGLAPVTRQSGTSLNAETRSRRGSHRLKNAMFLAAFASLRDPASKAFYDRKRAEGKRHNATLICPARRPLRRHPRHPPHPPALPARPTPPPTHRRRLTTAAKGPGGLTKNMGTPPAQVS
jgi:hypothetical protein